MTMASIAAAIATLVFSGAMLWAGISDLVSMKIRNRLVLILLGSYAAAAPLSGFSVAAVGWSASVALLVLLFTFTLFALGWIGGGDAKLAAAIALWLGPDHVPTFLIYTGLFGGVLALLLVQFRAVPARPGVLGVPWIARLHASGNGIPYGVALAAGALVVLPQTGWIVALSNLQM